MVDYPTVISHSMAACGMRAALASADASAYIGAMSPMHRTTSAMSDAR